MRDITRSLMLFVLVLLIPIVPFVLVGERLEPWLVGFTDRSLSPTMTALFAFTTLTADILLPVPSSVICTFVGDRLGWVWGTTIAWSGLTAGGLVGYGLAAWGGTPLARRFADVTTLRRMHDFGERAGPVLIVLTRPVPVLAEATVLWLGVQRVGFQRLMVPLAVANAAIAAAYAALGRWAGEQGWLVIALVFAAGAPLLLWWEVKRRLERLETPHDDPKTSC